jgi:hypothetical protein
MKKTFTQLFLKTVLFWAFFHSFSTNHLNAQSLSDLIFTKADVSPITIISGVTDVSTYAKIENNGYATSARPELRIYIKENINSATSYDFGLKYFDNPLEPAYSTDEVRIDNKVSIPAGNYYMCFLINRRDDVEESDLTNNLAYVPITILANITVETDVNGSVSGLKTTGYTKGEIVNLVASPNEGCEFVNWTEGSTIVSASSSLEFAASENRTLKANFKKKKFTIGVTSNPAAGGQNSSNSVYEYGTEITLNASPNTDYCFVNWTVNGVEVSANSSYKSTVTDNANIVANFKKCYTIQLAATGDGVGTLAGEGIYSENASVTIKATPSDNSRFIGWYKGATLYSTIKELTFTTTESLSLTARFDYITHLITVSVNNSNYGTIKIGDEYINGSSDGARFIHNTTCNLTAEPYNDQYTFKNWTENGTVVSTDNLYSFLVTTDRDLVANFKIKQYTLTLQTSDGGTVTGQGLYNYNATATMRATPNTGYSFVNWTNNGVEYSKNATETTLMTVDRTYQANFAKKSFAITLSTTTGGTVSGSDSYEYGSTCIVTATTNSGYAFVNWTEGTTVVSTNASYSFTVSAARTLKANFAKTYTITLQSGTGGSASGQGTFNSGSTCTVTASPYTGYKFANWTEGTTSVSTNTAYSFTVSANKTLKANFEVQTFSIALEASTGGTVSGQGTFNSGSNNTVIATPSSGYNFVSWTENGAIVSTSASYTFTVNSPRSLKANFVIKTFAITLETSTGGTVSGQGTFNYGASNTITATSNEGYNFVSWTENGTVVSSSASYTFTVNSTRSLKANFAIKTFAITLETSTGGTVSGQGTFNYGTNNTVTATPNEGYDFVGWTENGVIVSTSASYTFTVNSTRSLKANFAIKTFAITLETSTGGTVSGQGTFNYSSSITVSATPSSDYAFLNWTEGSTVLSTDASYTFTVSADRTLKANFIKTYTITLQSGTGGSATGQGTYNSGSNCTVTAIPNSGYKFANWTEGTTVVSTNSSYSFTVNANKTLKANFEQTFSVTLEASTGGTVSGQGSFNNGSNNTVVATPSEGYDFVSWTENGTEVSTSTSYTFTVNANRTLKANFSIKTFTISLETSAGGTVNGQGVYNFGTSNTIIATPNEGYKFVNWIENGAVASTSASYTFTVKTNRTLTATFAINTGIEEPIKTHNYSIYPNPASDFVYINLDNFKADIKKLRIAFYDISGKTFILNNNDIDENVIKLNISHLPANVYTIELTINDKCYTFGKVVIVK